MADNEYLTVPELAELLRVKERKIYDLAASGEVPCSRATGKLLFPSEAVRAWIGVQATAKAPTVVLGSHDPLLDWAIRNSGCGLATFFDGSHDGIARFKAGEGVATGLHLFDPASDRWNIPFVTSTDAALIRLARRRRGIVCAEGTQIRSFADLAGRSFVPRQTAAGASSLFQHFATQAGLSLNSLRLTDTARTEDDAVQSVLRGEAEACFGLEHHAQLFNLRFVPVVEECFDLLIDRRAWFEPPLQRLMAFLRSERFTARAMSQGGYDLSELGQVIWNA